MSFVVSNLFFRKIFLSQIHVYYGCIRSILEYCAPLFVDLFTFQSDSLEKVQNRCHRLLCGSDCSCSYFVPLKYRRIILAFKLFLDIAKDTSHPLFRHIPSLLPRTQNYRIPMCSSSFGSKSFFISMCKLANSGFSV